MANGRRVNPVYRSVSPPLTILGAEITAPRLLFLFDCSLFLTIALLWQSDFCSSAN